MSDENDRIAEGERVIEPNPLSKYEREICKYFARDHQSVNANQIRRLLAAEQFWREAVKNAPEFQESEHGQRGRCVWCSVNFIRDLEKIHSGQPYHQANCPWLLAQD